MSNTAHSKTVLILVIFIVISAASASADPVFDWGGSIDYLGTLGITPDTDYNQELNAGLRLAAYLSDDFTFKAKGTYTYTDDRPLYADADYAWLRGQFLFDTGPSEQGQKSLLHFTLGRFRFKEFSGYVFNHTLDGAQIGLQLPFMSVSAGAGYTGLTFMPSSSVIVTRSDYTDHNEMADHGFELSPEKLIGTVNITFPSIAFNQNLLVSVVAQQDIRQDFYEGNDEDELDTEYFGIGVQGRTFASLYHDVFFFLNTGRGKFDVLGYLAGGELRYYNKELLFSRVSLGGIFSSGDKEQDYYSYLYGGPEFDGSSSEFVPISDSPSFGLVFSPQIGNITLGKVSYSIKPFGFSNEKSLKSFQLELLGVGFFRSTNGIISNENVDPDSTEKYLGTEVDLTLRYRPFSDLGLSLTGGMFFPNNNSNEAPLLEGDSPVRSAVRAQMSFSY